MVVQLMNVAVAYGLMALLNKICFLWHDPSPAGFWMEKLTQCLGCLDLDLIIRW